MFGEGRRRIVILAAGKLDAFTAKTAAGIVRYRGDEVVGVLDPEHAGEPLENLLGVGKGIPVVASLSELDALDPDTLIIGVATPGGKLPPSWRGILREALERRMQIVSGLHTLLSDDEELSALARQHGARLVDIRRPPVDQDVGMARARDIAARTVLTVGSDCNVGKKIAAIEICRELERRGEDALFLPTGQTGVMISGRGIAIDCVVSDFVSGAVEKLVLEHRERSWLIIEGQGALYHPSYSGVTLGLMHGACPRAMVLCHQPTREHLRHTNIPIPALGPTAAAHETLLRPIVDSHVVGVALNCLDLSDDRARAAVRRAEQDLELPATDVVRFGAAPLVDALVSYFDRK